MENPHLLPLPPTLGEIRPVTDPHETERHLCRLVVPGSLADHDLQRRIARLRERFRVYAGTIPFGLWGEGLALTQEMRATTDLLLPLEEVRRAFRRLIRLSLPVAPSLDGTPLQRAASWLDCLERLEPPFRERDPARLLELLAADGELRTRFLFALFVPRRHGANANRYPDQGRFLHRWLEANVGKGRGRPLRCLDAACGAGEGTYGLARLLVEAGFAPDGFSIVGASRDPLEIFAAAHGFFPHDPARQEAFRHLREELRMAGALERIRFTTEDLTAQSAGADRFDVIICNGILGGPFMHGRQTLERVVAGLVDRLAAGGIILAADRFHGGWKRVAPPELLGEILAGRGLSVVEAGEGRAGIRGG
ncbi:CheR family methyltransferase [Geobacter sp.]|uniref:CheR family methyltransferase n=1 Tax=Geobacter sp. TaxID=46610 RepID=UPI0027B9E69E|nr:CheR family methyltransferase [Geobacter sp.]